jgi:hypothetical protein
VTAYDPDRLAELGAEYARCHRRLTAIRPQITEQIRAAGKSVPLGELIRLSRLGREQVRRDRDGLDRTSKPATKEEMR